MTCDSSKIRQLSAPINQWFETWRRMSNNEVGWLNKYHDGPIRAVFIGKRRGTKAKRRGTKAKRRGTKAKRRGTMAKRRGTMAKRRGTMAKRRGTKAKRRGTKAKRRGANARTMRASPKLTDRGIDKAFERMICGQMVTNSFTKLKR
jgi:hypothetical protein